MKPNTSSLIAILSIAAVLAAITYGAAPAEKGRSTVEKQLLAEVQQTNELLSEIHTSLVEMKIQEQQEKTIEQMVEMNSYLESIDEKVGEDSDTLKAIKNNINNSKNPICVLEQLEDIKTALNNMN